MVKSLQRKGSRNRYFEQRIPLDVKARAIGLTLAIPLAGSFVSAKIGPSTVSLRFSLRTADPVDAKIRNAEAGAYLEAVWRGLRENAPASLTPKQATALAGILYRSWADEDAKTTTVSGTIGLDGTWTPEAPPLPHEMAPAFENIADKLSAIPKDDEKALEGVLGPVVDRLLIDNGIQRADGQSRLILLGAFRDALMDAFRNRQRNAEGDYSPDPKAQRFPEWQPPASASSVKPKAPSGKLSLLGLVDGWWIEAKAGGVAGSTYEAYRRKMQRLVEFLGDDDASLATPEAILGFKDMRLASGVMARTVKDNDLSALRAVFGWAVVNRKIASNPAAGITVKVAKATVTRSKGFTEEEAKAILSLALRHKRASNETPKIAAAKRWVPWLCAYTGARVGELAQLRKQDIRQVGDEWVLTITPEAGTVKDKEVREVVLHPHLVEQGFPEFVRKAVAGYLFLTPNDKGETLGSWRAMKNRLAEFAREVVKDKKVAPNHGWRHTFKTIGRQADIADTVLDAICGHEPGTVGGSYGEVTLAAQARAFERFPRFLAGG